MKSCVMRKISNQVKVRNELALLVYPKKAYKSKPNALLPISFFFSWSTPFIYSERVGFEPTVTCATLVFKTNTLNHSDTSPYTLPYKKPETDASLSPFLKEKPACTLEPLQADKGLCALTLHVLSV